MVSQLIFTNPTISSGSLADEAERFMAVFRQGEATALDSVLLAILKKDTRKVLNIL
jgi:hypothetical protein